VHQDLGRPPFGRRYIEAQPPSQYMAVRYDRVGLSPQHGSLHSPKPESEARILTSCSVPLGRGSRCWSGGRFVKNVTRLARQQACYPSPVQRHVEDSFYEQRRESALLPDEVSLAHHGILLLDELPACRRHVLVVLRQPLGKRITARQLPTDLGVCTLAMLVARMTILMGAHDTAVWHQNRHGHTQKC
jgi:Magnesium chelatase, subunit ChlI